MSIKNKQFKKNIIQRIYNKILGKIYGKSYIYRINVEGENFYKKGFYFVPLDINNLDKMAKTYKSEISSEKYKILYDRINPEVPDKTFVLIDDNEKIHGFCSMCFGDHWDESSNMVIPADSERIYFFDGHIFEEVRGRGSLFVMIKFCLNIAKEKGYKYATCIVVKGNKGSEINVFRSGFERIGHINHYTLGGKVFSKVHEWSEEKILKFNSKIKKII